MPWPSPSRPLVCYVTDRRAFGPDEPQAAARLLQKIARVADAGADAIQLREKDLSGRALLQLTEAAVARAAAAAAAASILVNDRLDAALAAGAAGVHLGGQSLPVAEVAQFRRARRAPAGFLIGRSCHALEEALQAERDAADYLFFGPVFATPSKAAFGPPQGIDALAAVCRRVQIPVFAIGGITLENASACTAAGAAGVAAIRLFQESEDVAAIVRRLKQQ
ncbi:MAG TPA: thiamine phosphate synthase [Candidatus Acidoferrales bacterium]|nr:thiamine phosphate synthase [Candidatus Acidoferrales bacterium]